MDQTIYTYFRTTDGGISRMTYEGEHTEEGIGGAIDKASDELLEMMKETGEDFYTLPILAMVLGGKA